MKLECFDPVEIGHPGSINSGQTLLAPSDPLLSIWDLLNIKFTLSNLEGVVNWCYDIDLTIRKHLPVFVMSKDPLS